MCGFVQLVLTHQHVENAGTDNDGEEGHGREAHEALDDEVRCTTCSICSLKRVDGEGTGQVAVDGREHEECTGHRVDTES